MRIQINRPSGPSAENALSDALKGVLRAPGLVIPQDIAGLQVCMRSWHALEDTYLDMSERLRRELTGLGLNTNELYVLVALGAHQGGVPLSTLIPVAKLSQSGASRMIERMEERGLVARETGADDRRHVLVSITATGEALVHQAAPVHARCVFECLLAPLGREQGRAFWRILMKLRGEDESPAPWDLPNAAPPPGVEGDG